MTLERAIEILELYNKWRIGELENWPFEPIKDAGATKIITDAIDMVVTCHKRQYENWPREKTNE